MTNRLLHDCRKHWKEDLNFAFVFGNRFDVAVYRSRADIEQIPEYAQHVGKLLTLKKQYAEFLYDRQAKFVCDDELSLPDGGIYAEYKNGGKKNVRLSNRTEKDVTINVFGNTVTVTAKDVACTVI